MIIYLDFDGTIVEHDYPRIGREVPHALRVTGLLIAKGHKVLLNTMRADLNGNSLEIAMKFINYHPGHDFKIHSNTPKKVLPAPWPHIENDSLFIDDQALNMPLIPAVMTNGDMVNWLAVERFLIESRIL